MRTDTRRFALAAALFAAVSTPATATVSPEQAAACAEAALEVPDGSITREFTIELVPQVDIWQMARDAGLAQAHRTVGLLYVRWGQARVVAPDGLQALRVAAAEVAKLDTTLDWPRGAKARRVMARARYEEACA